MSQRAEAAPAARTGRPGLPARTRLAAGLGRAVAGASRRVGAGGGSVVGGRVTLAVDPGALSRLARGHRVALVSGTNGKTTTTRLLTDALGTAGPVASNPAGSNMPAGLTAAAAAAPAGAALVFEVDEPHLPAVAGATAADLVVLLNLSRDQLDRVAEVRRVAGRWRDALGRPGSGPTVVANADDPLVWWAAMASPRPVWVAAGSGWHEDAALCPSCAALLDYTDPAGWRCLGCGLARPRPEWWLAGEDLVGPGLRVPLRLRLPGGANRGNAALAVAAAASRGVPVEQATAAVGAVESVAGRYRTVPVGPHQLRLLLAKNPAGWAETLRTVADRVDPVCVVVNARVADGRDPSWLWDVPFERLRGRRVVAAGERRADLAVRLEVAGVSFAVADPPLRGVADLPAGPVDVIANYTAFQDLRRVLRGGPTGRRRGRRWPG